MEEGNYLLANIAIHPAFMAYLEAVGVDVFGPIREMRGWIETELLTTISSSPASKSRDLFGAVTNALNTRGLKIYESDVVAAAHRLLNYGQLELTLDLILELTSLGRQRLEPQLPQPLTTPLNK